MRIFVTGATGFIGSAVVKGLIQAGHQVLGLSRGEEGSKALLEAGAQVLHGSTDDQDILRHGATSSDGVIHLAFNHDFSKFVANCEADRKVIEILGGALLGSERPLIVTSGTNIAIGGNGEPAKEGDPLLDSTINPRAASEEAVNQLLEQGANVSVVRLPQVHDNRRQGLVSFAIQHARHTGLSAYIGEGHNRWPAAHRLDVARLYRLALERRIKGARYHAVAEEGISMKEVAELIGAGLKVPVRSLRPEEAMAHFGWLAMFVGLHMPASGLHTQQLLKWQPSGPGLLQDLRDMDYSQLA